MLCLDVWNTAISVRCSNVRRTSCCMHCSPHPCRQIAQGCRCRSANHARTCKQTCAAKAGLRMPCTVMIPCATTTTSSMWLGGQRPCTLTSFQSLSHLFSGVDRHCRGTGKVTNLLCLHAQATRSLEPSTTAGPLKDRPQVCSATHRLAKTLSYSEHRCEGAQWLRSSSVGQQFVAGLCGLCYHNLPEDHSL
ncbi:hypothetical protein BDU57DRAFT_323883 [Ampelomyces quisqualis]|uniref:Uncharacterized protein n=1 Tax=Ampelomyces quisqualis TaxID=50730 RepID=A0A6A5QEN7_AMPQU|nr:hypothetical protein BDU57DRAFT_323883 [Ampelomyces quisqualis]